jgi:hypothetical protein
MLQTPFAQHKKCPQVRQLQGLGIRLQGGILAEVEVANKFYRCVNKPLLPLGPSCRPPALTANPPTQHAHLS